MADQDESTEADEPIDVALLVLQRERVLGPMMLTKPSANRRPTPWDRLKTWMRKLRRGQS